MHIDATIAPLAPGKLLVNPERFVPNPLFDGWQILPAPPSTLPADWPMYLCSPWVSMNVLVAQPGHGRGGTPRAAVDRRVDRVGLTLHPGRLPARLQLRRIVPLRHLGYPPRRVFYEIPEPLTGYVNAASKAANMLLLGFAHSGALTRIAEDVG